MMREPDTGRFRGSLRGVVPAIVTVILVYVLTFSVPGLLSGIVDSETVVATMLLLASQWLVYLGAIVVGLWLAIRLDRGDLARYGLAVNRSWLINFVVGVGISLFVSAVYFGYGSWRGYFSVYPDRITALGDLSAPLLVTVVGGVLVVLLLANMWEEVVFRGIMVQNFAEGLRRRGHGPTWAVGVAVIAHAVLFGLYHVPTFFVLAWYTSVIGVIFALAYLLTGKLGLAIGVHFGRFPMEVLTGEDLGAVELPEIVAIGSHPMRVSLEILAIEFVISCTLLFAWGYYLHGDRSFIEGVYEAN